MRVLAIDTSTARSTAGVALVGTDDLDAEGERRDGVRVLASRHADNGKAHGELLAGLVAGALDDASTALIDLDAVVVGAGPGPFTGLRVGIVHAAVTAELLDVPLYGVGSLAAVAAVTPQRPLLVVSDARRREVYWSRFEQSDSVEDAHVDRPPDVPVDGTAVTGSGCALYPETFGTAIGAVFPTVAGLVQGATQRILAGAPGEVVEPRYLRRPDAVVPTGRKSTVQR